MKKSIYIFMVIGFFAGCKNSDLKFDICPKSYFTERFPKRSIDLSKRLGESVQIELATPDEMIVDTLDGKAIFKQLYHIDTINLSVKYDRNTKTNILVNTKDKDTIFYGFVSKYREYFYLTEKKTDSTYWIGALNIDFDSIQGLGMIREQMCDLEDFAVQNRQNDLIKKADTATGIFEFYADKKLIREVYPSFLGKYPKLKILSDQLNYQEHDWQNIENKFANNNHYNKVQNELIESLYPNPAVDVIQIDFTNNAFYVIELIDNSGRFVFAKKTRVESITIPVNELDAGLYLLRVFSTKDKNMETQRIIIK